MSPEQNSPDTTMAPSKSHGGKFAMSLFFLLLEVGSFWDHPSTLEISRLLVGSCITAFCALQLGLRTFDPIRTAARTANMQEPTRSRLKHAYDMLQTRCVCRMFGVIRDRRQTSPRNLLHCLSCCPAAATGNWRPNRRTVYCAMGILRPTHRLERPETPPLRPLGPGKLTGDPHPIPQ